LQFLTVEPGMWRTSSSLGGDWPLEIEETLAPGRYEIEIARDGFRTRVERVDVAAHRTADVDVTLDPL
jgi:hypothetical protein